MVEELTLECLLHVQSLLGTGLKVWDIALGLTEGHRPLGRDHAFVLFHVDLVANHHLDTNVSFKHSHENGEQRPLLTPVNEPPEKEKKNTAYSQRGSSPDRVGWLG